MSRTGRAETHALLIGTSEYPNDTGLGDRPAVLNNLDDLQAVLTDPALGGVAPGRCHVLANPDDPLAVAERLDQVASTAVDGTLLVYYAGHGILDDEFALHLGVRASAQRLVAQNSFRFADLRALMRLSPANTRVLILDCCYSGQAAEGLLGSGIAQVAETAFDGAFVLASTSSTAPAHSLPGERHTAFTGRLLGIMRDGIPGGPESLYVDTIYRRLHAELRAAGLPTPRMSARDGGLSVPLVRNAAWTPNVGAPTSTSAPPVERPAPAPRASPDDEVPVPDEDDVFVLDDAAYALETDSEPGAAGTPPPLPRAMTLPSPGARPPRRARRRADTQQVRLGGPDDRLGVWGGLIVALVALVVAVAVAFGVASLRRSSDGGPSSPQEAPTGVSEAARELVTTWA